MIGGMTTNNKGGNNANTLTANDFDERLVYMRSWESDRKVPASHMDLSITDQILAVSFKNNDIAHFDLSAIIPTNSESIEGERKNEKYRNRKVSFVYNFKGFHMGSISSLDVCLQRPLFLTCSPKDSTIRIWNYNTFRCELARRFNRDIETSTSGGPPAISFNESLSLPPILNCAAFHPTGYYIAAGFIDKLRIFHVMTNQFRNYREINIKNVTQVKFSNGGQWIATASPKTA